MHQAAEKSEGEAAVLGPRSEGGVGLRKKGQGLGNRAFGNNSQGSYFKKRTVEKAKNFSIHHLGDKRFPSKPHTCLAWEAGKTRAGGFFSWRSSW